MARTDRAARTRHRGDVAGRCPARQRAPLAAHAENATLNGYSGSWDAGREGEPSGEPRLGRSLALPGRTIVNTHLGPGRSEPPVARRSQTMPFLLVVLFLSEFLNFLGSLLVIFLNEAGLLPAA